VRRNLQGWLCIVGLWAVSFFGSLAIAQDEPEPAKDDAANDMFWFNKDRSQAAAASQIIGVGDNPLAALTLRTAGLQYVIWDEVGFGQLFAPELSQSFLRDIRDGRPLPNLESLRLQNIPPADLAFVKAYSEALVNSFETPLDAFKKSADENRTVTHAHLMSSPARYRGKVIPITGRMVRLRREEPTHAAKERGVKGVYVAWVFGATKHANPFCLQFPILPPGLEPSEQMNEEVTFYGYFLATYKYEGAKDRNDVPRVLTTPLLVGPTILPLRKAAAPVEADTPMAIIILGLAVSFLLFLSVVFFLMFIWFQRGDRKVLNTLDEIKSKHMPNLFEDEPKGTQSNPVPSQLIMNGLPPTKLPEARPIDPERN